MKQFLNLCVCFVFLWACTPPNLGINEYSEFSGKLKTIKEDNQEWVFFYEASTHRLAKIISKTNDKTIEQTLVYAADSLVEKVLESNNGQLAEKTIYYQNRRPIKTEVKGKDSLYTEEFVYNANRQLELYRYAARKNGEVQRYVRQQIVLEWQGESLVKTTRSGVGLAYEETNYTNKGQPNPIFQSLQKVQFLVPTAVSFISPLLIVTERQLFSGKELHHNYEYDVNQQLRKRNTMQQFITEGWKQINTTEYTYY
jgi:hypothetical protein